MSVGSNVVQMLGPGLKSCPKCGSDSWKSASMVVLEGTSFTKGKIEGNVSDPGSFSGGMREFLLSDRWFSWDYKLDAGVELTTTSGLAIAVKTHMIEFNAFVQMPQEPTRPPIPGAPVAPRIGFFERVRPVEPKRPSEPAESVPPEYRPWYSYFLSSAWKVALIFLTGYAFLHQKYLIAGHEHLIALGGASVVILIYSLIRSFSAYERKKSDYDSMQALIFERHRKKLDDYQKRYRSYQEDCKKAEAQQAHHEKAMLVHQRELALHESAVAERERVYAQELAAYKEEGNKILKLRELLWERARLCSRCGTPYQGTL